MFTLPHVRVSPTSGRRTKAARANACPPYWRVMTTCEAVAALLCLFLAAPVSAQQAQWTLPFDEPAAVATDATGAYVAGAVSSTLPSGELGRAHLRAQVRHR
jgi:anti-sigma-K factor RskA